MSKLPLVLIFTGCDSACYVYIADCLLTHLAVLIKSSFPCHPSWKKWGKKWQTHCLSLGGRPKHRPKFRNWLNHQMGQPVHLWHTQYPFILSIPKSICTAVWGLRVMVWQAAGKWKIQKLRIMSPGGEREIGRRHFIEAETWMLYLAHNQENTI